MIQCFSTIKNLACLTQKTVEPKCNTGNLTFTAHTHTHHTHTHTHTHTYTHTHTHTENKCYWAVK